MEGHIELLFSLVGVIAALVGLLGKVDSRWVTIGQLSRLSRIALVFLGAALFVYGIESHH